MILKILITTLAIIGGNFLRELRPAVDMRSHRLIGCVTVLPATGSDRRINGHPMLVHIHAA